MSTKYRAAKVKVKDGDSVVLVFPVKGFEDYTRSLEILDTQDIDFGKKTVYVLTRPYENCILGVYSKREYAEKHRQQCFDPSELEVQTYELDGDLDDLFADD